MKLFISTEFSAVNNCAKAINLSILNFAGKIDQSVGSCYCQSATNQAISRTTFKFLNTSVILFKNITFTVSSRYWSQRKSRKGYGSIAPHLMISIDALFLFVEDLMEWLNQSPPFPRKIHDSPGFLESIYATVYWFITQAFR